MAKAIYEEDRHPSVPTWEQLPDIGRIMYECLARAALAALADNVSEDMVRAMREPYYDDAKIEAAIRAAGEG